MLYNQEQREILGKAADEISHAGVLHKAEKEAVELRTALYKRKKDFAGIAKLTESLETAMKN